MQAQTDALSKGNTAEADKMRRAVGIFTHQLNMSNPVLTQMTDAMEAQSDLLDQLHPLQTVVRQRRRLSRPKSLPLRKRKSSLRRRLRMWVSCIRRLWIGLWPRA